MKNKFLIFLFILISSTLRAQYIIDKDTCPDGSKCSSRQTCCEMRPSVYGCCPYESATCCSDGEHCCPHGYNCDISRMICKKSKHDNNILLFLFNEEEIIITEKLLKLS
jgi:hypothetical protein